MTIESPALVMRGPTTKPDKTCPKCGEVIPPPVKGVTPRQRDVIVRLAAGENLREAAASLRVSRKTVEKHVEMAKERLGVKTLAHLVATAVKSGLITL